MKVVFKGDFTREILCRHQDSNPGLPLPVYVALALTLMGRSGGLVVNVLAFYSDNPSLNPLSYLNFLYEKTKINEKEAGVGPS